MRFQDELNVAIEAVRQAAEVCRRVQAGITHDVIEKKDRSPVTVADFASQAIICSRLRDAFGSDAVIAEEDSAELRSADASLRGRVVDEVARQTGETDESSVYSAIDHGHHRETTSRFWTLDPIDGTKGFIRGEQYAISLALIEGGEIQVGVLGCPNLPEEEDRGALLTAVKGQGASIEPLFGDGPSAALSTTSVATSAEARLCESVESGHSDHSVSAIVAKRLGIESPSVRLDSQAKYAVVAQGQADIYMRLPSRPGYREKIWDHAAGVLQVTEAGGRVTDILGNDLDFGRGALLVEGRGVLATNGHLHDEVIAALRSEH